MLNAKVLAIVAAVLVLSSVSVRAMEFADRPGTMVVGSLAAKLVAQSGDLARRQVHHHKSLLGADEQTMTILNSILASLPEGPGRLSDEYSPTAVDSGNFERRHTMIGSRTKVVTRCSIMRFEDRPCLSAARVTTPKRLTDKFGDRTVTAGVRKTPFALHYRPNVAEFCAGSIAPCGSVSFAQPVKRDS